MCCPAWRAHSWPAAFRPARRSRRRSTCTAWPGTSPPSATGRNRSWPATSSRGCPRPSAVSGSASRHAAATPADTAAAGEVLGRTLGSGDVVALYGELGAGKTCFVQGLARGLDVRVNATSPTFVMVNEYRGRLPVHHVDAYRAATLTELID